MKSRVHPRYKTKYRVKNWASYDRALVRRGDITIWLSPAAIAAWEPDRAGTRGAQRKYSDLAIESALTLRLLFHLPLRQAEGFLTALFVLMGLDLRVPDHTTLSRRGRHLDLSLRRVPKRAGLHLIIDSSGLSIVGEGEWATAKHGRRGRRGWKKLHLGVDPQILKRHGPERADIAHHAVDARLERAGRPPRVERGLDLAQGVLVILDGGKGLRSAVRKAFRHRALVQRCQWHKRENVVSYLARTSSRCGRQAQREALAGRFGGHNEHRRERRLRLAQRDPACT